MIRHALSDSRWSAVVSYSRDEMKAADVVEEFRGDPPFKAFLGDVRDSTRLSMALKGVDVVVHAAALKRVDVGAYSPSELIATNILGTMNVVNAAIDAQVKRVVVISSDKACAPTNLYGATKMCAETYAVQANSYGYPQGTRICAVRYGNILGSRGSVIHIWRAQQKRGEPITVTDERMTRFVMTIEEACELIEFAIDHMQGGEVFIPALPSARMCDLARAVVGDGYPITFTGLRPGGEKLAESLLNDEEPSRTRMCSLSPDYFAIAPTHHEWVGSSHVWHGTTKTLEGPIRSDGEAQRFLSPADLAELMAGTEACR